MSSTAKKVLAVLAVAAVSAVTGYFVGRRDGEDAMCWYDCQCDGNCDECEDDEGDFEDDEPKTVEDLASNPE